MSYRHQQPDRNWGALVACLVAVPLILAWSAISVVGGSLVCADAAAHCDGVVQPLLKGVVMIVASATALGCLINLALRTIAKNR